MVENIKDIMNGYILDDLSPTDLLFLVYTAADSCKFDLFQHSLP